MIKAIIIDDENASCLFLKKLIAKYCPEIEIVGIANTNQEAVALIDEVHPHLIFLDVQLLKENEISFFNKSNLPPFEIIITSPKKELAVLSYTVEAVDYLLKPIKKEPLFRAMIKYDTKNKSNLITQQLLQLQKDYNNHTEKNVLIAIKQSSAFIMLNSKEIIYLEADGNQTKVFIKSTNLPLIADEGIGDFVKRLPIGQFHKIHKSLVIRLKYIKKYGDKGEYVMMINDKILTVANLERQTFLTLFRKK